MDATGALSPVTAEGQSPVPSAAARLDRLLGYHAVDDPVGTNGGRFVAQRDDHVVPSGVGRLGNVCRRRVRIGVGVRVKDADHRAPIGLGSPVYPEMLAWVDGVDARRRGQVDCGVHSGDGGRRQVPGEEPATFSGAGTQAVRDHLVQMRTRQVQARSVRYRSFRRWRPRRDRAGIAHQGRTVAFLTMVTRKPTGTQRSPGKPRALGDPHEPVIRSVARNRRARHDYDILEVYECGIALKGAEVKSLRLGQASLQDAYARIDDGELWLLGAHLAPYEYASGYGRFEPVRARKLLLHRQQIDELSGHVAQKALTLVPLSIYFKDGLAKVELALARGRRLYDKRHAIAERDANREAERVIREHERRR